MGEGYAPFNTRAGIAFYIQSPNYDSQHLLSRHRAFLQHFAAQLEKMDEHTWQRAKEGLLLHISERDKNLRLRAQRLWIAITNDFHQFDMQPRLIAALERLTLAEVSSYINEMLDTSRARLIFTCN